MTSRKTFRGGVAVVVMAATLGVGVTSAITTARAAARMGAGSAQTAKASTPKTSSRVRAVFTRADTRFDAAAGKIDRDIRTGLRTWKAQIDAHNLDLALQGLQLPRTTGSDVRSLEQITKRLVGDLNAVSAVSAVDRRAKKLALAFARQYLSAVAALAVATSPSSSDESKLRALATGRGALKAAERNAKNANLLIGCTPSRCGGFFAKPTAFLADARGVLRGTGASTPNASTTACANCRLQEVKTMDAYQNRLNNASQYSGGWAAAGDLFLVLGSLRDLRDDIAVIRKNCKSPARFDFTDLGPLTATSDATETHVFRGSLVGTHDPYAGQWSIEEHWTNNYGGGDAPGYWEKMGPIQFSRGHASQLLHSGDLYGVGLLISARYEEFLGQEWIDPNTMSIAAGTSGFTGVDSHGNPAQWSGEAQVPIKCTPN